MTEIDFIKQSEMFLAMSYWENFKFEKELAQSMTGMHPRVKKLNDELNKIREEWHETKRKLE